MRLSLAQVTTRVGSDVVLVLPDVIAFGFGSTAAAPGAPVTLVLPTVISLSLDLGGSLGAATEGAAVTLSLPAAIQLSLVPQALTTQVTTPGVPITLTLPAVIELSVSLAGLTMAVVVAPLSINGITVQVRQGGHHERYGPLATSSRSYGGQYRSAIDSNRGYGRRWPVDTVLMDRSDAISLEAVLVANGRVTASGKLVGGGSVLCYAAGVERRETDTLQYASLGFELIEAEP